MPTAPKPRLADGRPPKIKVRAVHNAIGAHDMVVGDIRELEDTWEVRYAIEHGVLELVQ